MRETVNKANWSPESYSSETGSMVGCANKNIFQKEYPLIRENGGSYIDGIPLLQWGEYIDNTYCGCVTAALNASGIAVSYEKVMGLSGVCYQAMLRTDWDPSSQMPQNGLLCEKNVGDALGISVYSLHEEHGIWERAKKSIDNGIPVLLVAGRWAPEWTIACGYTTSNHQYQFFGRTYFDILNLHGIDKVIEHQSTIVPKNETHTKNSYYSFNGFPGWFPTSLTRFYDQRCQPISPKQALKVSLETCLQMFEQKSIENSFQFGFDAYDELIGGFLLDDDGYQNKCVCDQYHLGCLIDARRAAYLFLKDSIDLLQGSNKTKLSIVAEMYHTMYLNFVSVIAYEKTTAVYNVDSSPVYTKSQRTALAKVLTKNKEIEKQLRAVVTDLLDCWETK